MECGGTYSSLVLNKDGLEFYINKQSLVLNKDEILYGANMCVTNKLYCIIG